MMVQLLDIPRSGVKTVMPAGKYKIETAVVEVEEAGAIKVQGFLVVPQSFRVRSAFPAVSLFLSWLGFRLACNFVDFPCDSRQEKP